MKTPGEYKNNEHGRIIDGIFDAGSPTCYLYEDTYNRIRANLKEFRAESPAQYDKAIAHMRGISVLEDKDFADCAKAANKHNIGIENTLHIEIVRDWAKAGFHESYQPKFMLSVGTLSRPVRHDFFNAVGKDIEAFRAEHPDWAAAFDAIVKQGSHAMIYADRFEFKGTKLGRGFAQAMEKHGFGNGLRQPAAETYISLNPARQPAGMS